MRVGDNPLKNSRISPLPKRIGAVITHLPTMTGYHSQRFDIVRACLNSMRENSMVADFAVAVWDNGSCQEFRDWLQETYQPDVLVLSRNIGKASARTALIRSFALNTVLGVSDDDILFFKGYWQAQERLLDTFPNVGVVSTYPVRTQGRWGNKSTLRWAANTPGVSIEWGRHISEEHERQFCASIGRDYGWHQKYTAGEQEALITYNGVSAYAQAHHCQFMAKVEAIEYIVQWDDEALSDERQFDNAIDDNGMLRLCTVDRYARHMGNVLDAELRLDVVKALEPAGVEHA